MLSLAVECVQLQSGPAAEIGDVVASASGNDDSLVCCQVVPAGAHVHSCSAPLHSDELTGVFVLLPANVLLWLQAHEHKLHAWCGV